MLVQSKCGKQNEIRNWSYQKQTKLKCSDVRIEINVRDLRLELGQKLLKIMNNKHRLTMTSMKTRQKHPQDIIFYILKVCPDDF